MTFMKHLGLNCDVNNKVYFTNFKNQAVLILILTVHWNAAW